MVTAFICALLERITSILCSTWGVDCFWIGVLGMFNFWDRKLMYSKMHNIVGIKGTVSLLLCTLYAQIWHDFWYNGLELSNTLPLCLYTCQKWWTRQCVHIPTYTYVTVGVYSKGTHYIYTPCSFTVQVLLPLHCDIPSLLPISQSLFNDTTLVQTNS